MLPNRSYRLSYLFYGTVLIALACINGYVFHFIFRPDVLTLSVLPVASGQAILVQTPHDKTVLVNTGGDHSLLRIVGETLPEWQRSIDALILTSTRSAYRYGATDILSRYAVPLIIYPLVRDAPSALGTALRTSHQRADSRVISGRRGMHFTLDRVDFTVIWPPVTPKLASEKTGALALLITYGRTSFLIHEMASAQIQARLSREAPSAYVLSSSTPQKTFFSDGVTIRNR